MRIWGDSKPETSEKSIEDHILVIPGKKLPKETISWLSALVFNCKRGGDMAATEP